MIPIPLLLLPMGATAHAQLGKWELRLSRQAAQGNMQRLLDEEDTNGDRRITVADAGDKRFELHGAEGQTWLIEDTYHLANLLQELALGAQAAQPALVIRGRRIYEPPAAPASGHPVSRMIRDVDWDRHSRRLDADGLSEALSDPKLQRGDLARLYVPHEDRRALEFYRELVQRGPELQAQVVRLPENITPEYVQSIPGARLRVRPGLLTLAMQKRPGGEWAPQLDAYFKHDRAMRESGHDTTWRLAGRAAHLNTVALNSLLYKYASDIARIIKRRVAGQLETPDGTLHAAGAWRRRARKRKRLVNRWLWHEERGMYFDYDFAAAEPWEYINVGRQFAYVPEGGFGWTNASAQVGLQRLRPNDRDLLNRRVPPEWIF